LLTKRLLSAYLLAILVGPLVIAACSDDDNGTEPARTGACCRTDGTCVILTSSDCSSQSGAYQGDNVSCNPSPCPAPATGACCAADESCSITTQANCTTGTYLGNNSVCDPNPCGEDAMGACCADSESCIVTTEDNCTAPSVYMGNGTVCTPNPCEGPAT